MNGILLVGFLLSITSIFTLIFGTNAFAQTFGTIKNEKYGIQFQVPIDWTVTEKQSRFDEGADITVRSPEPLGGVFTIPYDDAITLVGSENIQEATDASFLH